MDFPFYSRCPLETSSFYSHSKTSWVSISTSSPHFLPYLAPFRLLSSSHCRDYPNQGPWLPPHCQIQRQCSMFLYSFMSQWCKQLVYVHTYIFVYLLIFGINPAWCPSFLDLRFVIINFGILSKYYFQYLSWSILTSFFWYYNYYTLYFSKVSCSSWIFYFLFSSSFLFIFQF